MGKVRVNPGPVHLKRLFRGRPQRDYKRQRHTIEYIFTHIFPQWGPNSSKRYSQSLGIPPQRLYDWKARWMQDPEWRPWLYTLRGEHHRVFSDAEERAIADYIVQNYLVPGALFTDSTFREIAMTAYLEKSDDDQARKQFNCSPGFIASFKQRNRFSSRRAHLKRRPVVSEESKTAWVARLSTLLRDVADHTRIINVDESCWRVHPGQLQTWAPTGSQNVSVVISGSDKESFTVVAAITAARTKLPLCLIAVGKTSSVEESHFGEIGYHHADHSESGWQTEETFMRWIHWLRALYDDGNPIWVVLDCYSVHRAERIRAHAGELGINFLFVPPGLTDEFQPLDRFVFGALKATSRRLYALHCRSDPFCSMDKKTAAGFLIRAWEGISTQVLEEAWAIYDPGLEE
jgi:hypothetical protein